ncbi:hypothetical protein [Xylanimonas protaetiae]|uniref:hypothetical protein n=1 Tax=Xylanimonas protaetiae TaxID=2509457 RepID=UPI001F5D92B1|nr:hypothetical protein [Xylanimonas protaetiae]
MSALRAPAYAPSRPAAPARRTRLTALDGGRVEGRRFAAVRAPLQARSATPFLVMCGALLAGALLTVLVLNTSMAYGSFEMSRLRGESNRVAQDIQVKQQALRTAENGLDARARRLGMVPSEGTQMLDVTGALAAAAPLTDAGQPLTDAGQPDAGRGSDGARGTRDTRARLAPDAGERPADSWGERRQRTGDALVGAPRDRCCPAAPGRAPTAGRSTGPRRRRPAATGRASGVRSRRRGHRADAAGPHPRARDGRLPVHRHARADPGTAPAAPGPGPGQPRPAAALADRPRGGRRDDLRRPAGPGAGLRGAGPRRAGP